MDRFQARHLAFGRQYPRRTATVDEVDAFFQRFLDFELRGRHFLARLEGDHGDGSGTGPRRRSRHVQGFGDAGPSLRFVRRVGRLLVLLPGAAHGTGGVQRLGHRSALVGFLVAHRALPLVVRRSKGCTGGVHGNVPAADNDHLFSDVDLEALVGVDEEFDGAQHAIGFVALDVETSTEGCPDGDKHGIVTLSKLGKRHVGSEFGV